MKGCGHMADRRPYRRITYYPERIALKVSSRLKSDLATLADYKKLALSDLCREALEIGVTELLNRQLSRERMIMTTSEASERIGMEGKIRDISSQLISLTVSQKADNSVEVVNLLDAINKVLFAFIQTVRALEEEAVKLENRIELLEQRQ